MIEVNALLFTLLAEGVGLLAIILIVWIIFALKKKSKDKVAAITLVKNIKTKSEDRKEGIKTFLSQSAGLEGEELQLDVKKLDRLEKDFFTQIVHLYLKRDGEVLSGIDEQFDKVISAYKGYISQPASVDSPATTTTTDNDILAKLESLQKENVGLTVELGITKETMGNMMAEFNTMFSGGNDTVQISKEALQTSVSKIEEEQQEAIEGASDIVDSVNDEGEIDLDDILLGESITPHVAEPQAEEAAQMDVTDIDDVLLSAASEQEPSATPATNKADDDFGEIVSIDDVDDLLDGIDLSKDIDMK